MPITRLARTFAAALLLGVAAFATSRAEAQHHDPDRRTNSCHSNGNKFQRCQVGPWDDAELIRQDSRTACVRGDNWDLDGTSLWVSGGCRGLFAEVRHHPPPTERKTASCHSNDNKFQRCRVGAWDDAELIRQDSRTACVRGDNWDLDGTSLWVSGGCRGLFAERRRHHTRHPPRGVPRFNDRHQDEGRRGNPTAWQPGPSWNREIRFGCHSTDNKYRFCTVDVGPRGTVELAEQMSRARCIEGQSWGWNRAGLWVDHGCRASFVVHRRR